MIPQGIRHIGNCLPEILEDAEIALPWLFRQLLRQLGEHLKTLTQLVEEMEQQIHPRQYRRKLDCGAHRYGWKCSLRLLDFIGPST